MRAMTLEGESPRNVALRFVKHYGAEARAIARAKLEAAGRLGRGEELLGWFAVIAEIRAAAGG